MLFTNSHKIERQENSIDEEANSNNYDWSGIQLKPNDPWFSKAESERDPLSDGEDKVTSLQEALNPDGTLKEGMEGSFDPTGFNMRYGPNGEPIFTPKPFGEGDQLWQAVSNNLGLNGPVWAVAINGANIYIGGDFTQAGGNPNANYVALWNGSWNALGNGTSDGVRAIAINGSNIYVGGYFGTAGGVPGTSSIARWDGNAWNALGSGLNDGVLAIAISGSNIYVGGVFENAGGSANADRVAFWNGSTWNALGAGINNGIVNAIAISGTDIYVGGSFVDGGGNFNGDRIARWNGSSWNALSTGIANGVVNAIATSGSNVFVGGSFTSRILQWNGSTWNTLGTGISSTPFSITIAEGNVYVSGAVGMVAVWNGSNWDSFSGIGGTNVNSIAVSGSDVYIGGAFTNVNGDTNSNYLAVRKNNNWNGLKPGLNSIVNTIAISGNNVFVGGTFTNAGGNLDANGIARWNGANWLALGTGVDGTVNALTLNGSNLYVGGSFVSAGGIPGTGGIAVWNGSNWNSLSDGLNGSVLALALYGLNLYVGGSFENAGGNLNADNIAMWDGSDWRALGEGLNNTVTAIAIGGSEVYVGGYFHNAGGKQNANYVANWDGSNWNSLGAGIIGSYYGNSAEVYSLAVHGSNVYVGGEFIDYDEIIKTGISSFGIVRWDGSNWNHLGDGDTGLVRAIQVRGNNIYANSSVWNGDSWTILGTGLNHNVNSIAIGGDKVYFGGSFTATGDNSISAYRIIQRNGIFPTALLHNIELVNPSQVKFNGTVNAGGLSGTYYFQYGTSSINLNNTTTVQSMSGSSDIAVSANVSSVAANTTYFYRLVVQNEEGVSYSDIQSYTFPPEIEVRMGSTLLNTGSEYDFGNVNLGSSSSVINFNLYNLGIGNLNLTGSAGNYIVKGGSHPSDFTVVQSSITSPIEYNTNQQFTVQFTPSGGGVRTATLTIGNNDPDEGSYVISLKGTGKLSQSITFSSLPVKVNGEAPFALTATASSGLAVSYASTTPSVATVSGNMVTIVGPGTTIITASQAGNVSYNHAPNIQQTLTVREAEPTTQASSISFSGLNATSLTIGWSSGNGTARLVVARQANAVSVNPTDGLEYSGNSNFSSASDLGSGNKVVYRGSENSVSVSNLLPNTVYHFRVYELNGSGTLTNYLTNTASNNPNSRTTLQTEPTAQPTSLNLTTVPTNNSMQGSFTAATGSPTGYIILRNTSAISVPPQDGLTYTAGTSLVGTSSVVFTGSGTTFSSTNLAAGTTYHYAAYAYNGTGQSVNYLTTNPAINNRVTLPDAPVVTLTNPTSIGFGVEWNAVPTAIGYKVDIATDDSFEDILQGYPKDVVATQLSISGLQAATPYFVRVRAVNSSGESVSSIPKEITTDVGGVGQISIDPPVVSNQGTTQISVKLNGGSGVPLVKFFSKGITSTAELTEMIVPAPATGNTYQVQVPTLPDELGLEYYFTAADASGTASTKNPGNQFLYKSISQNEVSIPNLSFGGEMKNYRIISIPYVLTLTNSSIVFSALQPYDNTKWRLLQFNGTTYTDNPTNITVGKSYWFNTRQQASIELGAGTVSQNNQENAFVMSLNKGWNMIGNPYPFAIDWDDVLAANHDKPVDADYFVFNPTNISYAISNSLKPFEGGFVYAEEATTLQIPVVLKNTSGGRKASKEEFDQNLDADNWLLPITLKQGEIQNTLSAVGMHKEASLSKDRFDRVMLPPFLEYLQMTTSHPESFVSYFVRDVVPTRKDYVWNFDMESSRSGAVELHWDQELIEDSQAQLLLYDATAGQLLDMRTTSNYVARDASGKVIQFIYSKEGDHSIDKNHIGVAHPNPFVNEVKLPGYYNASGDILLVSITILNVTGVEVFKAEQEINQRGLVQPIWKGVNNQSNNLPSGLYIYRVAFRQGDKTLRSQGKILKQ